jgi:hypothetical protein
MNRKLFIYLLMMLAGLLCPGPSRVRAETGQASEYQVKAAYLYHFAKFVEWPADTAGKPPATLMIAVLGKSSIGAALEAISGSTVKNRRVVIVSTSRVEELKGCDILFVCMSERVKLDRILASVASRPILTVSDIRGFAASGGMIGFVATHDNIRFEINHRASQRSGLIISSQLLKLATEVIN